MGQNTTESGSSARDLTHLAPDHRSLPTLFPYRETPDRPVAAG